MLLDCINYHYHQTNDSEPVHETTSDDTEKQNTFTEETSVQNKNQSEVWPSLAKALGLGPRDRRFESCYLDLFARSVYCVGFAYAV